MTITIMKKNNSVDKFCRWVRVCECVCVIVRVWRILTATIIYLQSDAYKEQVQLLIVHQRDDEEESDKDEQRRKSEEYQQQQQQLQQKRERERQRALREKEREKIVCMIQRAPHRNNRMTKHEQ